MGVLFSADLAEDIEIFLSFTPSNGVSREYNVYETYTGSHPDESTYWTNWNGYYDTPVINQIEVHIEDVSLIRVNSLQDCCVQPNSIYDEPTAGMIYINIPKHPWLYNTINTKYKKVVSFLSGPKNPNNPSDDIYNNEHWPVKLEMPKFNVKLSDVINGLTKYSSFDFTLFNNDGYFDDIEAINFFNSPSYIKKTWKEHPDVNDFIPIRYGIVESIKVNEKTIVVSCADIFRALEEPVSKVVKDIFPDAVQNRDNNLSVVYGQVTSTLIQIDENKYTAGENITGVSTVYNKNGDSVSFSFDQSTKIITSGEDDVASARVTGNTHNTIGEVITDIINSKTSVKYISSFWDLNETNMYVNNSPKINIAFTGGNVQTAVKNALKSDMVFLIQKNDGRFTLRKWGYTYNSFNLDSWEITKFPTKDYSDAQKNYLSSCVIKYNYHFSSKVYTGVLLFNENESKAEETYSKLVRKEFETYLTNETDAFNLGAKLSHRFSTLKETVQIGLGHDTSEINLLDTINLEININGRVFSKHTAWIVKEIDPAQDVLTLESI
jgi:hypothetical protein